MAKPIQSQAVRDLIWALETPSMVDHEWAITAEYGALDAAAYSGTLSKWDRTGSKLHKAVENRSSDRLGEYFEILVSTWMRSLPPVRIVAENEQVKGGGGTLGEFDLVFERDDEFHHWELAIKFYLGHPGRNGEDLWFGPNPKDRLDKKWSRMKDHQMMLGRLREGRMHLERLGVPDEAPVFPSAFLKGYLFESLDESYRVERMPETSNDVPIGWWVHRSEFGSYQDQLEGGQKMRWARLSRLQWMSPAVEHDRKRTRSFGPFEHHLSRSKPSLVAGLVDGEEVTRGFVVPDRWPG